MTIDLDRIAERIVDEALNEVVGETTASTAIAPSNRGWSRRFIKRLRKPPTLIFRKKRNQVAVER